MKSGTCDEAQALVDKLSRPWKAVVVGTPDGAGPSSTRG